MMLVNTLSGQITIEFHLLCVFVYIPTASLTKMSHEAKGMRYLERLVGSSQMSGDRRQGRDLSKLAYPKVYGREGATRTLQ